MKHAQQCRPRSLPPKKLYLTPASLLLRVVLFFVNGGGDYFCYSVGRDDVVPLSNLVFFFFLINVFQFF